MEQKKHITGLLCADAETAKKITEIYPADWEMEHVFRRSMKKYREMASHTGAETEPLNGEKSAISQRKITLHPNRFVTAACLLLTVGIAGGVAWMQISAQKPLSMMQSESASTTAPLIEEIVPVTTVAQTALTAPPDAENAAEPVHSTATAKTQPADSSPSESRTVPTQRTEPQTEAAAPADTAPRTEQQAAPQTYTAPVTTAYSAQTEPPAPAIMTEPEPTPPSEGNSGSATAHGDETNTEQPAGEPVGDSFRLLEIPERSTEEFYIQFERAEQITYDVPDEFFVDLEGYTPIMEKINEYSYSRRIHRDSDPDAKEDILVQIIGSYYCWSVHRYAVYPQHSEIMLHTQYGDRSAYFLSGEQYNMLVWYDGRYVCSLTGRPSDFEELVALAEAMRVY